MLDTTHDRVDWPVAKIAIAWFGATFGTINVNGILTTLALAATFIFTSLQIYKICRDIMKDRAKERLGLEPPPTKPMPL